MVPHSDIQFRMVRGLKIRPYVPSIARLNVEIFRESPYHMDAELRDELLFLEKYPLSKDSVAILVFDRGTLIGSATGIPLVKETEPFLKPFKEHHLNPSTYYHFGESLLLKKYQGRGITHHFFDLREEHVEKLKTYDHICFCHIDHPANEIESYHLHDFWRKRGYVKYPDMICELTWKTLEEKTPSPKHLIYWIKSIECQMTAKTLHASDDWPQKDDRSP